LEKQAKHNRKLSDEEKKAKAAESAKLLKELHEDPKLDTVSKELADLVAAAVKGEGE